MLGTGVSKWRKEATSSRKIEPGGKSDADDRLDPGVVSEELAGEEWLEQQRLWLGRSPLLLAAVLPTPSQDGIEPIFFCASSQMRIRRSETPSSAQLVRRRGMALGGGAAPPFPWLVTDNHDAVDVVVVIADPRRPEAAAKSVASRPAHTRRQGSLSDSSAR